MLWNTVYFQQASEQIDGIFGLDMRCHMNRQTFPNVFIERDHQLDRATAVGVVKYEIPHPEGIR